MIHLGLLTENRTPKGVESEAARETDAATALRNPG